MAVLPFKKFPKPGNAKNAGGRNLADRRVSFSNSQLDRRLERRLIAAPIVHVAIMRNPGIAQNKALLT
jgi:hypothetical protein